MTDHLNILSFFRQISSTPPYSVVLPAWRAAIIKRLAALRLTIHPAAHPRPVTEGIPFLGFVIFPQQRRLKRRKGLYYQRKLRDLIEVYRTGQISLATMTASVQGWINHVRYANTVGLRKAVFNRRLFSFRGREAGTSTCRTGPRVGVLAPQNCDWLKLIS